MPLGTIRNLLTSNYGLNGTTNVLREWLCPQTTQEDWYAIQKKIRTYLIIRLEVNIPINIRYFFEHKVLVIPI